MPTRRLVVGLMSGVSFGLYYGQAGGPIFGLVAGLIVGLACAFVFTGRLRLGGAGVPHALVPRWPRWRDLLWIIFAAIVFLPLLVPAFLSFWATPLADAPLATAARTYRADRRTTMIVGLVYAVPIGAGLGAIGGAADGAAYGVAAGLAVGLATWLTAWLAAGQVPMVKLTELLLHPLLRGRVHFLRLLEDGSSRQVLRQAGVAYQFRHAELQSHVAAIHRPSRAETMPEMWRGDEQKVETL